MSDVTKAVKPATFCGVAGFGEMLVYNTVKTVFTNKPEKHSPDLVLANCAKLS